MVISGKKSLLSTITAIICIILYGAAIIYGTGRIVLNSRDRDILGEKEFLDILDRASSAAVLGFMSKPYQDVIQDSIMESRTILGVIISGSNGEYGFERQYGTVINWIGNSPRFKTGFGISRTPYYQSVWIEGQRNTTVQAIHSYIDYDFFIQVLKETLIVVFSVMALAVFILLLEINLRSMSGRDDTVQEKAKFESEWKRPLEPYSVNTGNATPDTNDAPTDYEDTPSDYDDASADYDNTLSDYEDTPVNYDNTPADYGDTLADFNDPVLPDSDFSGSDTPEPALTEGYPKGLYSSRGIGWESYTKERLESELHRCASQEEDLVYIMMESRKAKMEETEFRKLINECTGFFALPDMIFEKGEQGLALIIPALNVDQGFAKSEDFRSKVTGLISDNSGNPADICIGLSSRSGRLVEAERLILETKEALTRAKNDSQSPVIAFKSDPEKYRDFISRSRAS